jgi:beta-glucosidase
LTASKTAVSFTLKNTGDRAGAEVAQLYLGFPASAEEPPRQLKGFSKVLLAAGASMQITIPLTPREMSIWDVGSHGWQVVNGEFTAWVGSSSRDTRLTGTFTV